MFDNKLNNFDLVKRRFDWDPDVRGNYFRDITAIIHSYPFRRLKHKTQVFFSPKNDHICTRIEHVMHVATIAATITKALGLDQELAWAIGLGHDLGHAPFGHVGERVISELLPKDFEKFHHELYSLRVVDHLINYGKGLNLTYAVRDGIATHCGEKFEQFIEPSFLIKDLKNLKDLKNNPSTYEGVVVRMADKIAYLGRDLEDALQLKLIKKEMIPSEIANNIGTRNSDIIDTLVNDIIDTSLKKGKIGFSDKIYPIMLELVKFNYNHIYKSKILQDYHVYFKRTLKQLYNYLHGLLRKYELDFEKYKLESNFLSIRFGDYLSKMWKFYDSREESFEYVVLDYIAGMTDDYALECIQEIMIPKRFEYRFDELLFTEEE